MQTKNIKLNFIFLLLTGTILVSCSLERKIAQNYVNNDVQPSVLLFFPNELIKSNLKIELALSDDSSKFLNQDSLIEANDLYLHLIHDSAFINRCKQSLITELKAYGMNVYGSEHIDDLIASSDTTYVLSLVQIQLEEYLHQEKIEGYIDMRHYIHDFDLNAINLNAWFELSKTKLTNEIFPVLYSSYFIYDDLSGTFVDAERFGEPVNLFYKIDSIGLEDINNLAELAGKKYAINFYDYLLNLYVQDHLPRDKAPMFYYHYNRRGKNLQTFYYDGFTEIDPENI